MKSKLVNMSALVVLVLSTVFSLNVSAASTACYIYLQGDCRGIFPANTWFADNYNSSGSNNGSCLHRAREYVNYCGLHHAGDQVVAAFNLESTTISAQVVRPSGNPRVSPTVVTYGLNWTPLITGLGDGI